MNSKQPEDYNISPSQETKQQMNNRLKHYRDVTETVHQALIDTNKTNTTPEYSETYSSLGEFFHKSNGFWDRDDNPEKSYLQATKSLPVSDEVKVSSIPIRLEESVPDGEIQLYATLEDGEVEEYWEVETEANTSEEIENLENLANRMTTQQPDSWNASESILAASD